MEYMKKYAGAIALFVFTWVQVSGQLITVRGDFSRDTILLGEQIRFTFTIDADSALRTKVPVFADTIGRDIEILEVLQHDSILENNRRILTQEYLVTSFKKGSNMVGPVPVAFTSGVIADTISTYPVFLYVDAPAIDTTKAIKPIKGPVNTPVNFAEILPWLLIGIGILMIAVTLFWIYSFYSRKKENSGGLFSVPREPAHIIALRELDALAEARLPENGMVKEYYTRLTNIVRLYMENAYQIPAMERITLEIIEEFGQHLPGESELSDQLKELLELADLVKFAKEDPLPTENKRNLDNAYTFVRKTHELQEETEAQEGEPVSAVSGKEAELPGNTTNQYNDSESRR